MKTLVNLLMVFPRFFRSLRKKIRMMGYDMDTIAPYFREHGVQVGEGTRIVSQDVGGTFGSEPYLVRLGNNCSIAAWVRFITHDGGIWALRGKHPKLDSFGVIDIRDNTIIGMNSIILPGVTIGPNCVIGAGSVVTRDIPPDTVAAGVPAKVLMTLDEYEEKKLAEALIVRGLSQEERKKALMGLWEKKDREDREKAEPGQ